jgi:hypothetical protein
MHPINLHRSCHVYLVLALARAEVDTWPSNYSRPLVLSCFAHDYVQEKMYGGYCVVLSRAVGVYISLHVMFRSRFVVI